MGLRQERLCLAFLVAAAILLLPPVVVAAEYSIGGQVYSQLGYNDNIQLSADDEVDSAFGIVAGEVNLLVRTPVLEFGIDGAADLYRYVDASDLNTDNQFVRGFFRGKTPRADYGIAASFLRDSDIVDQFNSSGPELTTDRRETIAVGPSFSYRLTPRVSLVTDATYQRNTYSNSEEVDSDFWASTLGWRRQWTRRTTLGGQLSTSLFDSDEEETIQVSPQVYLGYQLQEWVDLSLALGPSWTRSEQTVEALSGRQTDTSEDFSYAIDGLMELELTRATNVNVGVLRGLDSDGEDGQAVERTRIDASVRQQLTGWLQLQFGGTAQRRRGIGDNTGDDAVDVELGPELRYQLAERTGFSLGYRWRYSAPDDGGSASSNAIFIRLTYIIPPYRVAR